jgi:ABC-type phosphate transport system substrate-binding protein
MRTITKFSMFIVIVLVIVSCDNSGKDPKATGRYASINSGTFTCYIDEAVWDFLQPVFKMYDSTYPEMHATFYKSSSREAMAQFLAGNTKAIITPRDYLKDEDSLMKAFHVEKHERAIYALDGLVFFTHKDFPLDTLSDGQIKNFFKNKDYKLKKIYPNLKEEPVFVCSDVNSSEYANLKSIALNGELASKKIIFQKNYSAVKDYIHNNPNAIGIGYLSQVVKDDKLKCLRISFNDSSGKYIFPHVVHQANILRKYYPYIVNHYVYILEKRQDRVFWFAKFMEREFIVQSYFNKYGIVPAYAKIRLVEEE